MNIKRIIGILLIIGGVVLLGISMYIKQQVAAGEEQIAGAQQNVDTGNKLFSLSPATKQIGQNVTGSIQQKINEGAEQVAYYKELANELLIGGIVCVVLGTGVLFISRRKK